MNIKCAIYARYSSENQKETSIEDQIRKCREFAFKNGWQILEEHIYFDKAQSGLSTQKREQFNELCELISTGKAPFRYLLVDETSRLSRNINDALKIYHTFKLKNVEIFFVNQGINTMQEFSEEFLTFHALIDNMSVKETAKRTHRGLEGQFIKGFSAGGRHYGYKSKPVYSGKMDIYGNPIAEGYILEIFPEEAETVKRIFKLIGEEGYSARRIANLLNKELKETGKPRPPRGDYWRVSTIIRILQNELYIGKLLWNKTKTQRDSATGKRKRIINKFEEWKSRIDDNLRLISDQLWEKVQSRSNKFENTRRFVEIKKQYSTHLLIPYAKCEECGGTFSIVSGGKYAKYGCSNNWNKGSSCCKNSIRIKKTLLEELIIYALIKELANDDSILNLAEEIYKNFENYLGTIFESDISEIEQKLMKINDEIENMIKAIKSGFISESLKQELKESEKKKKDLENRLTLLKVGSKPDIRQFLTVNDIKAIFNELINKLINPENTMEALSEIVSQIFIKKNDDSSIKIKIIENSERIIDSILKLVAKKDTRIRLQTGTRLQPYTSRTFEIEIILNNDCNLDLLKKNETNLIILKQ